MSNEQDLLTCPKCETRAATGTTYCPSCGYEFSSNREGVGPFSFAFPAVESAYKPSGKVSLKSYLLMLAIGLPVGIVGGAILYRVHVVIATLASSAPTCLIVLGALALYFIAAALLGYVISLAVDKGAIIGKNRNLRAAKAVGFISGLASYGVYVSVYFAALGGEGLDSAIDVIKLVGYFLAIVLVAGIASGEAIAGTPFCEKDEEFMKKIVLGKYPIRHERALMEILASRKLVDLRDVVADLKLAENFTEVTAWHCDRCKETGFISAKTTQTRYEHDAKGNRTAKSETRLIYSSSLEKPGILAILAHAQPNQA